MPNPPAEVVRIILSRPALDRLLSQDPTLEVAITAAAQAAVVPALVNKVVQTISDQHVSRFHSDVQERLRSLTYHTYGKIEASAELKKRVGEALVPIIEKLVAEEVEKKIPLIKSEVDFRLQQITARYIKEHFDAKVKEAVALINKPD